jgi:plasmid stabilization system protein ParE
MRFAPQAEADLREALQYIRDRNAQAAHKLGERILAVLERLAAGDFEGHEQRLTTGEVVHSWPAPPFRIYYQRRAGVLHVLRIYHRARKPIVE